MVRGRVRCVPFGLAILGPLVIAVTTVCGSRTGLQGSTGADAAAPDGFPPSGGCEGGTPEAPSCSPGGAGMTNCGPGGSGTESCCTSLCVTGGTYYRTYTNDGSGATSTADPATVSSFRLDKYLVTVGRFRQFVAAWNGGARWRPAVGSGKHSHLNGGRELKATGGGYEQGWDTSWNGSVSLTTTHLQCETQTTSTWTANAATNERMPINCVTWYEAYALCIWDGGFLPSEAAWEYAAAGGSQQREHPWGSAQPGTACPGTGCEYAIYGCYYPHGSGSCTAGVSSIAPVGFSSQGAGLYGQLDLAGELGEWNLDWFVDTYVDPCTDCADVTGGADRIFRGGWFSAPADYLLPWNRPYVSPPTSRAVDVGLRCARTP